MKTRRSTFSSEYPLRLVVTVLCIVMMASSGSSNLSWAAENMQLLAGKFEKNQKECSDTMEVLYLCRERGWEGNLVMQSSFLGANKVQVERSEALNHLYKNGKFSAINDIFDQRTGACKSVIKVEGKYKGSDYSATLYCDKTSILESRLEYKREQTGIRK